jgi:hypothetical protein
MIIVVVVLSGILGLLMRDWANPAGDNHQKFSETVTFHIRLVKTPPPALRTF